MTLNTQSALRNILSSAAEAIEGNSTFPGVPGVLSYSGLLAESVTITAGAGSNTTQVFLDADAITAEFAAALVSTHAAPFFLVCATQVSGSLNVGRARKIASYSSGSHAFISFAPEWASSVQTGDTFTLAQGFKQLPDNIESIGEEPDARTAAFDRGFRLSLGPGQEMDIYGSGTKRFESELVVQLRIAKKGRDTNTTNSVLENAQRIRATLVDPRYWDGTYTMGIFGHGTRPEVEDKGDHVEVTDRLRVVYRIHWRL